MEKLTSSDANSNIGQSKGANASMTMNTPFSLPVGGNESFVLLANGAKGLAAVTFIHQVLEAPNVFVFGELLDHPNIEALSSFEDEKAKKYLQLLNIFAYGTYKDYLKSDCSIELTPPMKQKLRLLTLATLSTQQTLLPYSTLQEELEIENMRQLEDIIIEGASSHVVLGKLDQNLAHFEVDAVMARDMKKSDLSSIISTLTNWCDSCDNMLNALEGEAIKANEEKQKHSERKAFLENKASEIMNQIKRNQQFTTSNDNSQDDPDSHIMDTSEHRLGMPLSGSGMNLSDRKDKKGGKGKGAKSSGKTTFWPNR